MSAAEGRLDALHLDEGQRVRVMPTVAALVQSGGALIGSLRHGPMPKGWHMVDVSADETLPSRRLNA